MNNMNDNNSFNSDIDWSTIPILNEIANYLNKVDIITLSQSCKYHRFKLSSKVFYQLTLFNQVYWKYRKVNNVKLSGKKLKLLICAQMIEDLASKLKLVKKAVLTSRINSKFANLFFEKFKYCKVVIIDCKYDFKLSTVYNILKHLNYLEVFYMEAIYEHDPKNTLTPPNFKFPKTLKSISFYPYILEKNFIPAINEINFNTAHTNIIDWNITGNYNINLFFQQQSNVIHLYLCDIPFIEFNNFNQILVNNPQLKTLVYEIEAWSVEKLNTILTLPNLQKLLIINYCFDRYHLTGISLITNTTIKTLLIECITPSIIVEELLSQLEALKDIVFIRWNLEELSNINWSKFAGKFKSITLGLSFYDKNDLGDLLDPLIPNTKIIFNNDLTKIINYDLSF